jgi:hypothetical protein
LQVNPQVLAAHVAAPFAGAGQTLPQAPQLAVSLVVGVSQPSEPPLQLA